VSLFWLSRFACTVVGNSGATDTIISRSIDMAATRQLERRAREDVEVHMESNPFGSTVGNGKTTDKGKSKGKRHRRSTSTSTSKGSSRAPDLIGGTSTSLEAVLSDSHARPDQRRSTRTAARHMFQPLPPAGPSSSRRDLSMSGRTFGENPLIQAMSLRSTRDAMLDRGGRNRSPKQRRDAPSDTANGTLVATRNDAGSSTELSSSSSSTETTSRHVGEVTDRAPERIKLTQTPMHEMDRSANAAADAQRRDEIKNISIEQAVALAE